MVFKSNSTNQFISRPNFVDPYKYSNIVPLSIWAIFFLCLQDRIEITVISPRSRTAIPATTPTIIPVFRFPFPMPGSLFETVGMKSEKFNQFRC